MKENLINIHTLRIKSEKLIENKDVWCHDIWRHIELNIEPNIKPNIEPNIEPQYWT